MSVRSPKTGTIGSGGAARVYWPAGMEPGAMSPDERVAAFKRGWWRDGTGHIITKDGRRMVESGIFAAKDAS